MARFNLPQNQPLYDTMQLFVDAVLRSDGSLFTPGQFIWTNYHIEELYRRFVVNPDNSSDSFEVKFRRQLDGARPNIYQFAGELTYVHLMVISNDVMSFSARLNLINRILEWSPAPVRIPDDLIKTLGIGVGNPGMAYLIHRPYQLEFLLEFVRSWKQLSQSEQSQFLDDPWAFRQFVHGLPVNRAYAQRELVLHIVHPDTFEPIASREHKKKITQGFDILISQPDANVDQQLVEIREKLEPDYGKNFSFYDPRLTPFWLGGKTYPPEENSPIFPPEQSHFPTTLGKSLKPYVQLITHLNDPSYTPEQIVDRMGHVSPPIAPVLNEKPDAGQLVRDLLHLRLLEPLDDGHYRRWPHLADNTEPHLVRYAALTMLLPSSDGRYLLPILAAPMDGTPHPAAAWPLGETLPQWYAEAGLVERTTDGLWQALPDALAPLEGETSTIKAINTFLEHVQHVRNSEQGLKLLTDEALQWIDPDTLEQRIREIQRVLLIDRNTILRIYRALVAGQHVILSGPPGTGKTHLATLLPSMLWCDTEDTILLTMPTDPRRSPTEPPAEQRMRRQGYAVDVVTATEDWGIRDVIGGIAPYLERTDQGRSLVYTIHHGCLTRAVLRNYMGYDGETVPAGETLQRQEIADGSGQRYRGRWLVIDEFTRAPVDAAFGSLLTTLGGQRSPLLVPTDGGDVVAVPLPRDFRMIGTLNSFDRHFLNQMSEAMKRRFVFIDILPPGREYAEAEQGMAIYRALRDLAAHGMLDVTVDDKQGRVVWEDLLEVGRSEHADSGATQVQYVVQTDDADSAAVLRDLWRIFSAIRVYRQLGTAQAQAVYSALFTGFSVGMSWAAALDAALADTLVDQLQVLNRDEQRVLLAFLEYAAHPT
ncbi:MAG: AAA domain-containing protein, partial [Chloroflexaceae bacterium]|nr:AAA domain-containing protein [Chloroflexaceae bacterium]